MADEKHRSRTLKYEPESWRGNELSGESPGESLRESSRESPGQSLCGTAAWPSDECRLSLEEEEFLGLGGTRVRQVELQPEARDQTRLLELLGRINYRIIKGDRVYIEAGGVVYKTLYGGYWRSVFTGVEHYLFRCEQVSGFVWAEEDCAETAVDLPIVYSNDGWTASGHSLSFMLSRQ
jgi:hypothetical protein